ncbi:unnamed protein product, partial [Laminaria digitata]
MTPPHGLVRDAAGLSHPLSPTHSKCRQSPTLEKVEGLLASKKPAILSLERSSAGCRLEIDPDGNCFGTSWMLSSLLSSVQNPKTFSAFIAKLQEADKSEGGAFSNLDG